MKKLLDKASKKTNEYFYDNTPQSDDKKVSSEQILVCRFKDGDNFFTITDPNKRSLTYKVRHSNGKDENLTWKQFRKCIYPKLVNNIPLFNESGSKAVDSSESLF